MPCRLLPGVEDVAKNVADPECRSVASKAHATLLKVGADGKVTGIVANEAEVLAVLGSAVAKVDGQVGEVVVKYVASMMCGLINASQYKDEQWIEVSRYCLRCCLSASLPAAAAVLHRDLAVAIWLFASSCCCLACPGSQQVGAGCMMGIPCRHISVGLEFVRNMFPNCCLQCRW